MTRVGLTARYQGRRSRCSLQAECVQHEHTRRSKGTALDAGWPNGPLPRKTLTLFAAGRVCSSTSTLAPARARPLTRVGLTARCQGRRSRCSLQAECVQARAVRCLCIVTPGGFCVIFRPSCSDSFGLVPKLSKSGNQKMPLSALSSSLKL